MSEIDSRMLVHAITSHRLTLGALVNCVCASPYDLLQRARALVDAGALTLSLTPDESQLAVAPGDPRAIQPYADVDESGVVRAWLHLVRARAGHGTGRLRTRLEFDTVAGRYNSKGRGADVLVGQMPAELTRPWLELMLIITRDLLALGKPVRILIPGDLDDHPVGAAFMDTVADSGAEVHVAPHVDTSLVLWPGLGAVHFLQGRMHLAVDDVDAMVPVIDAWFEASDLLHQVTRTRVVRLLAAGHTDAVAARKLGISERQFRRHVSGLMQDLEATSRFQAGIEAARSMQW